MDAHYRKHNDRSGNSSTYHKKDGTPTRAILRREATAMIEEAHMDKATPSRFTHALVLPVHVKGKALDDWKVISRHRNLTTADDRRHAKQGWRRYHIITIADLPHVTPGQVIPREPARVVLWRQPYY